MDEKTYKYVCEKCEYKCKYKQNWNKHLQTKKHNDNYRTYTCRICNYICKTKSLYNQHLKTKKHMCNETKQKLHISSRKNSNKITHTTNNDASFSLLDTRIEQQTKPSSTSRIGSGCISKMLACITEQNEKLEEFISKQTETNKQLMELAKEPKIINHITQTNTTNNTNNTFNLNNFLTIECKDAPNFKDFIQSIEIGRPELEFLQKHGYFKSFENFVIKQLETMEQTKRPLHCLDQKRKKFIVKHDDSWTKEDIEKRVRYSIDHFCTLLLKEYIHWKDDHPNWKEDDGELNDIGLYLSNEILSPYNEKKNEKIETKVYQGLSSLIIHKHYVECN